MHRKEIPDHPDIVGNIFRMPEHMVIDPLKDIQWFPIPPDQIRGVDQPGAKAIYLMRCRIDTKTIKDGIQIHH
jgi:hypothetical protein